MKALPRMVCVVSAATLLGCQSVYYGAMEKVGVHKRDIFVGRVKDARQAQVEAKETFKTTLELFSDVVEIQSKDLEKAYKKLNGAYEDAREQAQSVRDHIADIESVSGALFKEWRAELKTYTNPALRKASETQYNDAQARYKPMMAAMKAAADQMDPVLRAFNDQVLFLKHNLNSAAIASLQPEVVKIKADVAGLIEDMEKAIAEADAFLKNMPEA